MSLTASIVICFSWTLYRGEDVNWDLQNYHLYDIFSLLHHRLQDDVAPAGPQTFLNPLPYLVPYLSRRLLAPPVAGLLVTACQLVSIMLLWGLVWQILRGYRHRSWISLLATICGATGAETLTELGTSFCDLTLASGPIASLSLLYASTADEVSHRSVRVFAAGAATGLVVGLKPTNLFLLPGLAAAALATSSLAASSRGGRIEALLLVMLGAVVGGIVSDGYWAALLWRTYRSPVFPYMNSIFRSPSAALVDFSDPRYHWAGLEHALRIVFEATIGSTAASELPIRDLRLPMALPLSGAVILLALRRASRDRRFDGLVMLASWLSVGNVFWLLTTPIERYAVSLELVSSAFLVLSLAMFLRQISALAGCLVLTLILVISTQPADFFHRRWTDSFKPRVPSDIPRGAVYGLLAQPLAYWLAVKPMPSHAFGLLSTLLEPNGRLQQRLDDMLQHAANDHLWLLNYDAPVDETIRAEMSVHGIVLAPPCLRAGSMVWIDTVFCRGLIVGHRRDAASDLPRDGMVSFSKQGDGLIYELSGWSSTEDDGTWAEGHDAVLSFYLPRNEYVRARLLKFDLSGIHGAPDRMVKVTADGRPVALWIVSGSHGVEQSFCLDQHDAQGQVVEIGFHTQDIRSLNELGIDPEPRHLAFRIKRMTSEDAAVGACP